MQLRDQVDYQLMFCGQGYCGQVNDLMTKSALVVSGFEAILPLV